MYSPRRVLSGLCALALCQCATGPEIGRVVTLQPGDEVRVAYRDVARGVQLTLQNESIETAEALYSRGTADSAVKVARDDDLQRLLDALATNRFFQIARPFSPDSGRPALSVEINGQVLTWERQNPAGAEARDLQDFNLCFSYFSYVYNSTESFHAGIDVTGQDMQRQQQALDRRRASQVIKTDRL